ncbi:hypothetical protein TNCV_2773231 [Trichonephila clavipes]|nr:hypothetical protein TNCV_2773231 [Trichonephila clavipes]
MGDLTYAENVGMHYVRGRENGNREMHFECITRSFLIDECWITEFSSGYISNFVKHVWSTSPYMMRIDDELYAAQVWKKAS